MTVKIASKRSPYESSKIGRATFSIGAENTNAITVSVQLFAQDEYKEASGRLSLDWYLSSDANGDSLATAANGGVAAGTDGVVASTITGRAGFCVSESDGDIDFVITDSGTPTVYLVLRLPNGALAISGAITFA